MLNKKGISPLIATVLIIGFTIIIAVLVITWVNNLVGDQTDVQQCQAEAGAKCSDYYNLLTFELKDNVLAQVTSGLDVATENQPEVVVTLLDSTGESLAVKTLCGTASESDCDHYWTDEGIGTLTSLPADTAKAKFLIKASAEHMGEPCEVACGEGVEVASTPLNP